MTQYTFETINAYMMEMMGDSAHDYLHIYRVLYQALRISKNYTLDRDVLIASCLLHDIGRKAQFEDTSKCHAVEGGKLAYDYLKQLGWDEQQCSLVRDCITTHRFRSDTPPRSIEAKILFDADKLDVTGALGIARSLLYEGKVDDPLYRIDAHFQIVNCFDNNSPASFLKEYHFKLKNLYDHFFTPEATVIAQKRKTLTELFYSELLDEIYIGDMKQQLIDSNGADA